MAFDVQPNEAPSIAGELGLIWLVEDSPLEAQLVCQALASFEVTVFADGASMLERRSTHGGPALLILDVKLPGLSGLEICKFLRASVDEVNLPILMLTVQGSKADIVEALAAGANDYLTKPYDAGELVGRVAGLIRTRSLSQALQAERLRLKTTEAERELLLNQAREAWKRAEEANRVKDDFLAVVSHELRTPLNAIVGWIELLKSGNLSAEKMRHALDTVERNARSQAQLIDDLLDVSRIITGKLLLEKEVVDFEAVTRLAHDAIEPAAGAKKVALSLGVSPGNYEVLGDPVRLQQIVWNLLSNAVKFTSEGGSIDLRLESTDHVRLSISDSGRGIDPELLPFIFDRFRQGEGSITRRYGGLGLGLAIVKHLAQLHGGSVTARSAGEGRGATFVVELSSATTAGVASSRGPTLDRKRLGAGQQELLGVRVLAVDDDDDSREVLAHLLGAAGAEVRVADSSRAAQRLLDAEPFDVMVSDIGMPEEDGYALIRSIRQRDASAGGKLPAIGLTAYARVEDRAAALHAGFNAHVAKPVDAAEIITAIAGLFGRAV